MRGIRLRTSLLAKLFLRNAVGIIMSGGATNIALRRRTCRATLMDNVRCGVRNLEGVIRLEMERYDRLDFWYY